MPLGTVEITIIVTVAPIAISKNNSKFHRRPHTMDLMSPYKVQTMAPRLSLQNRPCTYSKSNKIKLEAEMCPRSRPQSHRRLEETTTTSTKVPRVSAWSTFGQVADRAAQLTEVMGERSSIVRRIISRNNSQFRLLEE